MFFINHSKLLLGIRRKESSTRKNLAKYQRKVSEGDKEEAENESQSLWTGTTRVRQADTIEYKLKDKIGLLLKQVQLFVEINRENIS